MASVSGNNLLSFFLALFIIFFRFGLAEEVLFVNPSNPYNFQSIQSAIDAVPSNNDRWIEISVRRGVYNEKVTIPSDKQFIHLKGEGMGRTFVVWGDNSSMVTSSTISFLADNTVVSGMTIVNSHNYPPKIHSNNVSPAVAAMIRGDKSAFYKCSFLGFQDTLLDDRGRHYFKDCNIVGAVDFIFGNGQSIYEKCRITVNTGVLYPNFPGYITAQGREHLDNSTGYVFKECRISVKGTAFLGRAYRNSSRVVFYKSYLPDNIVPQGWDSWGKDVNRLTYFENQCRGSGSDTSNRVKWGIKLSLQELQALTEISFIDTEGWIGQLPINVLGDDHYV